MDFDAALYRNDTYCSYRSYTNALGITAQVIHCLEQKEFVGKQRELIAVYILTISQYASNPNFIGVDISDLGSAKYGISSKGQSVFEYDALFSDTQAKLILQSRVINAIGTLITVFQSSWTNKHYLEDDAYSEAAFIQYIKNVYLLLLDLKTHCKANDERV